MGPCASRCLLMGDATNPSYGVMPHTFHVQGLRPKHTQAVAAAFKHAVHGTCKPPGRESRRNSQDQNKQHHTMAPMCNRRPLAMF